jgi:uncharacterized protein (DUF488 family)
MSATLYTIGHSTRELGEFMALLDEHRIERIVDVRRYPGSRRHPQFGSEALRRSLEEAGIAYRHALELGGRRRPAADSPNLYWRSDSFRAYADYMMTPEFRRALGVVLGEAELEHTAVMCAEAVPWRCHRNLISDSAVGAGATVRHIVGLQPPHEHTLNEGARVRADGGIWYPGEPQEQGTLGL